MSLAEFTQYAVQVCSPGPVSEAVLVIVYWGLYWLFSEQSLISLDTSTRQDCHKQARICEESLQIILSNLSFHIPESMESTRAMYMAVWIWIRQFRLSGYVGRYANQLPRLYTASSEVDSPQPGRSSPRLHCLPSALDFTPASFWQQKVQRASNGRYGYSGPFMG